MYHYEYSVFFLIHFVSPHQEQQARPRLQRFDWWTVPLSTRVDWKCSILDNGVVFATMFLTSLTLWLFVNNLVLGIVNLKYIDMTVKA